ncbi:peptidoglycan recognition protein family protein [Vacuolonema iberomarrocanum]|uniref:peptidoglycan recognition protein family protein n=1 Tax=Vacuolonema iberomarrocanum TaxID=3454632 RepID=UPI003F6DD7CB
MSYITSYLRRLRERIGLLLNGFLSGETIFEQRVREMMEWLFQRPSVSRRWAVLTGMMVLATLLLGNMGMESIGAIAPHLPALQAGISAEKKPASAEADETITAPERNVPSLHALADNAFVPPEEIAPADPSNYGERYLVDAYGNPIYNDPIVVLHETVGSADSAINTFQTYHPRDADQRSYHALVRRDGTIVYIVPPEYRAFGAGNSVFDGPYGPETVSTNPNFPPSVNNFAYHISLETPSDGRGNQSRHSGYTGAQYRSIAWLTARTGVPWERITTHQLVDRSGTRRDPRSFDASQFSREWQAFFAG